MEEINLEALWRLADVLPLQVATALIAGYDPGEIDLCRRDTNFDESFPKYYPVETAMKNAVLSGTLRGVIRRKAWNSGWVEELGDGEEIGKEASLFPDQGEFPEEARAAIRRGIIFRAEPDWTLTTVKADDLRAWLINRGIRTGFFFPNATNEPDYLDPNHPNYAPKLAAAIGVWQAVIANPDLLRSKSAKQAMMKWLRQNADRYGLTKEDGTLNEQGIEEVAKVANWSDKGGAPKTN